jgi:hypothetical protein
MYPHWLQVLSVVSLVMAAVCSLIIAADLFGHGQHMWIMNIVWPVTALYFGPVALWAYFHWGRTPSHHAMMEAGEHGNGPPAHPRPFWQMCALATTHCGSGCVVGDIIAEWALVLWPFTLFGHMMFAAWVVDYGFALLFGLAFQYFTIKPMRNLSVGDGLLAAVKADVLALTAWQVGMYGAMAIATFGIFGHELEKTSPVFWFAMQLAMWWGFATSYPVNWWLLKRGIKEEM